MRCRVTLIALLLGLLAAAGCQSDPGAAMFAKLLASDFGIGAQLGATRAQTIAKLGQPKQSTSAAGGRIVTESYIPQSVPTYAPDTPQLTVDYNDGALTRLTNTYRPFDNPAQPDPPYKLLLIPGVGLGSRKSDFDSRLGKPNFGALKDQWRFVGKDGRSISVQALFTNDPKSGEPICTKLVVALAPKVAEQRGEQYEGKK
jgi:hypothetical protein